MPGDNRSDTIIKTKSPELRKENKKTKNPKNSKQSVSDIIKELGGA